jgi:hypothetical protein
MEGSSAGAIDPPNNAVGDPLETALVSERTDEG